ncbi:MAG TPA: DUF1259 domain-containing protein [Alloacidobacterium sp.]|nr:DUF1259 domain-containing protein [Alloacidobacterium sp.]
MRRLGTLKIFQAGKILTLTFALAAFSGGRVYAATDWSAIESAMKVNGVILPHDVMRFELVRTDIGNLTVNGQVIDENESASGFVSFKEIEDGNFFADGSIPVRDSELETLETALRQDTNIHITAIANRLAQETPSLLWLHFEASENGASLATSIASALATINSPQLNVFVLPGTENIISLSDIPQQFQDLFKQGFLEQLGNSIVFYLPRPDEKRISLGRVPAELGLGVGQSFYSTILGNVNSVTVTMDVDFALRKDEVQQVSDVLRSGGFSVTSQSNNFVDDNPSLYYVHAYATGNGFDFAQPLFTAVQIIQADSSHDQGWY